MSSLRPYRWIALSSASFYCVQDMSVFNIASCLFGFSVLLACSVAAQPVTRVGVIGLDTSHSTAFTKLFNDEAAAEDLAGFRVIAAYPHGSADIASSVNRIPGYTKDMQALGIEIVASIDELLDAVDVVLLETNDGRLHYEQALQVFKAGKPVFIDKPIAASLVDAIRIFDAAKRYNVPVFTASSLRYTENAQAIRSGEIGNVLGADAYSPATLEPTHPDLFWYGIHGVELLFTVMNTGCETVQRTSRDGADVVVGIWNDGRIGTFRGMRTGTHSYGGTAFGADAIREIGPYDGYRPLVVEIARFFKTGVPPVDPAETLEIYAFMEAADESKRQGGRPVNMQSVLDKAKREAVRLDE